MPIKMMFVFNKGEETKSIISHACPSLMTSNFKFEVVYHQDDIPVKVVYHPHDS